MLDIFHCIYEKKTWKEEECEAEIEGGFGGQHNGKRKSAKLK